MATLTENKKAYFNYEILEKFEAGLVLTGQEVKSMKLGRANLYGSYVVLRAGEIWLIGSSVPPYQPKNAPKDYNPERARKLLLTRQERRYLIGKSEQKGLTLIPLRLYTKQGLIKLEFGVGRGKKKSGKKEVIKKREAQREIERELKTRG